MKLCFSSMSSLGNILFVTTLAASTITHFPKAFTQEPQKLTSIRRQVPLHIQEQLETTQTNAFQIFSRVYILARNSDNPPPISDSSGGSR